MTPTIAILSDGYATDARFLAHAARVRDAIIHDPAFRGRVNVAVHYRPSLRDGLPTMPTDDTAYGSFVTQNAAGRWGGGVQNTRRVHEDMAWCEAQWAVLIWNTTAPFGRAASELGYCMVAGRSDAPLVSLHELGHVIGGLADEYLTGSRAAPDSEVDAPNLSIHADGRKWSNLIGVDGVGAFEGANVWRRGVYRPCSRTRMRDHREPFSPVDVLAIRRAIDAAGDAIPGDVNRDGKVDFADLNAVLSEFGERGLLLGDTDHDGDVDFDDLNRVNSNFGRSS